MLKLQKIPRGSIRCSHKVSGEDKGEEILSDIEILPYPDILISIDPGIQGSGLAVWEPEDQYPIQLEILRPYLWQDGSSNDWHSRAESLMEQLQEYVEGWHPSLIAIEEPIYFDDEFGQMAAKEGSFGKLMRLAGMMEQLFNSMEILVLWVPVREWKGQLPKGVVERRIKSILPLLKAQSHELDAVGVGLHVRGIRI